MRGAQRMLVRGASGLALISPRRHGSGGQRRPVGRTPRDGKRSPGRRGPEKGPTNSSHEISLSAVIAWRPVGINVLPTRMANPAESVAAAVDVVEDCARL